MGLYGGFSMTGTIRKRDVSDDKNLCEQLLSDDPTTEFHENLALLAS